MSALSHKRISDMQKIVVAGLFSAIIVMGWAEPIPAPVNGVVTIDISSNVTYDEPLPASSRLVKCGTGTATLTKASSDFSPVGEGVLIEGGTLAITDADATAPQKQSLCFQRLSVR